MDRFIFSFTSSQWSIDNDNEATLLLVDPFYSYSCHHCKKGQNTKKKDSQKQSNHTNEKVGQQSKQLHGFWKRRDFSSKKKGIHQTKTTRNRDTPFRNFSNTYSKHPTITTAKKKERNIYIYISDRGNHVVRDEYKTWQKIERKIGKLEITCQGSIRFVKHSILELIKWFFLGKRKKEREEERYKVRKASGKKLVIPWKFHAQRHERTRDKFIVPKMGNLLRGDGSHAHHGFQELHCVLHGGYHVLHVLHGDCLPKQE